MRPSLALFVLAACSGGDDPNPVRDGSIDAPGDADAASSSDASGADTGRGDADAVDATPDVDASPCGECDPHALCDIARDPPCYCTGGYEGDGRSCFEVVASLDELQWDLPCGPSRDAVTCESGDDGDTATMNGETGVTYLVELQFRGIVEEKTYVGGAQDGRFYVGGMPAADPYNVYELRVSDPAEVYYLNAGVSSVQRCWVIDYTRVVRIRQGATVSLTAQSIDAREILNIDDMGVPLRVPGLTTDPDPYDGQFVRVDVLAVTRAP